MQENSLAPGFYLGGEEVLPVPTLAQLAEFSGRPEASYSPHAATALRQATLLMTLRTCLVSMPGEAVKAELLLNGILELADDITLKQPFKEITAKPFSSETIMSYSYSKAAQRAHEGKRTGLMWFDLAVQELSVCEDSGDVSSNAVTIFERDGLSVDGSGRAQVLGPESLREVDYMYINPDPSGRRL